MKLEAPLESLLISNEYIELNQELHERKESFGGGRIYKWTVDIIDLIRKHQPNTLLDYGCGKGKLKQNLKGSIKESRIFEYDPGIPGKTALPKRSDLVVCTDVLEHVEPKKISMVIAHLFYLTIEVGFITIALKIGKKKLANNQPAHLNVHPAEWWDRKFQREADNQGLVINRVTPRLRNREKKDIVYIYENK